MNSTTRGHAICIAAVAILAVMQVVSAAQANDYHPACETPKKYIELVQQGKFVEVGMLFADNAVFFFPER